MVLGFDSKVLEDGVGPEPFHVILNVVSPSLSPRPCGKHTQFSI